MQLKGNYGGNCGNVKVKGTNECWAASTMDRNDVACSAGVLGVGTLVYSNAR